MLLETSPQLVRILRAHKVIQCLSTVTNSVWAELFQVRLLLDLSWDELRKFICPVHTIMGTDQDGLEQLWVSALNPAPSINLRWDSILWDLTGGSLRGVKQVIRGELRS